MNFGLPESWTDKDNADVVVLPICYENAPSYGHGSGKGPLYILDASIQLEDFDEEALVDWTKTKIFTYEPLYPSNEPEKAMQEIKDAALNIIRQKKFLLSIGGDHAISIGTIMAASSIYKDIGVLQIDAHLDLRSKWNNSRFNHACVMRRVIEDMKIDAVQVGIRSFCAEEYDFVKQKGLKPFYAHDIAPLDFSWIDKVVNLLPEFVYITLDLDGLDPSVIQGTGTPEPGGLSYRQAVELIKAVGKKRKVVAADINELVKIEGTNASEFTAARLAQKIIVFSV